MIIVMNNNASKEAIDRVVAAGLQLQTDGESIPYVAGWGEDGALEAVTEYAALIDSLARRIEAALQVGVRATPRMANAAVPARQRHSSWSGQFHPVGLPGGAADLAEPETGNFPGVLSLAVRPGGGQDFSSIRPSNLHIRVEDPKRHEPELRCLP